jgi:hypothetical protein
MDTFCVHIFKMQETLVIISELACIFSCSIKVRCLPGRVAGPALRVRAPAAIRHQTSAES